MFTTYFWNYLIKKGYSVDEMDNYVVDLSDWDFKKPIFRYEKKEFDFAALGEQFKRLIRKRKYLTDRSTGMKYGEFKPEVLVEKLYELLSGKIDINIALLEVLVYGFTAFDINKRDYDLGRNSPNMDLIGLKNAIDGRSFGASAGWNKLHQKVLDPVLFRGDRKPDHPLDVLFTPNEVLKYVGED